MDKIVRLAFIGGGHVNFGGGEGPWDHASRFEQMPGVVCVGVADVDIHRAQDAIGTRQTGLQRKAWANCQPFSDWRQMVQKLRPDAVIVGLPPDQHGHTESPRDVELMLSNLGVAMLIEKPLGFWHPDVLSQVAQALQRGGVLVSVGYMFRYAAAVAKLRAILRDTLLGPCVFTARYNCAYSRINKAAFWDTRRNGGPIIEQATHFLDLARYLCGEVDLDSLQVTRIAADSAQGTLRYMPTDDAGRALDANVPAQYRITTATLAQWRFVSGAVGNLAHGVLLHEDRYEAELEVWADGVRFVLRNPYGDARLGVRLGGCERTEWFDFNDDPYLAQDAAFIEGVRSGSADTIRCTYQDALKTYRLSWAIAGISCHNQPA